MAGCPALRPGLWPLLAVSILADVYCCQPLSGLIGLALGMPRESFGLIVTLSQVGYGGGLLLLVPLGDFIQIAAWW